jgi:hypothetical protein
MPTPATPITFTLANQSAYPMDIRNITYAEDGNIQHHSDYSNFAYGGSDNTSDSTLITSTKLYVTGDYLEKIITYDTHPRTVYYSTSTGTTLVIKDSTTDGLAVGWVANSSDNAYDGLEIVSITSATWLVMSGLPSISNPTVGGSIVFSTSTNKLEMNNTTGLYAGWQIIGNGYDTQATIISVVGDGVTLIVDTLPVNPVYSNPSNPMLFTSSTNYLTVSDTSTLVTGWTASGNGYDGTQSIVNIIDGNTVQMSGPPNSIPVVAGPITFTTNVVLITLGAGASTTFSINYSNATSNVGVNYASALAISAIYNSIPVVGHIDNFVSINTPPPPPPTYTDNYTGGGRGGGRGGGSYNRSTTDSGTVGGWGAGGTDGKGGASSTGGATSTA